MDNRSGCAILLATMATLPSTPRNRALYAGLALAFALVALGSRHYAAALPPFVARYAGDTLWATMVFSALGAIVPRLPTARTAALAVVGSYAVEISQLYQAPWIDGVRHTWLGGLVLGHGFLWSDIVCYTVGVGLGVGLELALRRRVARHERASARA